MNMDVEAAIGGAGAEPIGSETEADCGMSVGHLASWGVACRTSQRESEISDLTPDGRWGPWPDL